MLQFSNLLFLTWLGKTFDFEQGRLRKGVMSLFLLKEKQNRERKLSCNFQIMTISMTVSGESSDAEIHVQIRSKLKPDMSGYFDLELPSISL